MFLRKEDFEKLERLVPLLGTNEQNVLADILQRTKERAKKDNALMCERIREKRKTDPLYGRKKKA